MAKEWAISFYTGREWRTFRKALIMERGAKCERCHKDFTLEPYKLIAHHKEELTPSNIVNPLISLNPKLIEIVCLDCHNEEHQRFEYSNIHEIYLVYGPPCSGKSTFVNDMKRRGDLIINIDNIWTAISGCELYDKPDNIRTNVFQVHKLLIDQVRMRIGKWNNVFIEGGYPFKMQREEIVKRLKATEVPCILTKEECFANAEISRIGHVKEWTSYINKWFERYEA